ncbi:helix-turn-helix domain-containing protein [Shewanella algae]|uniref:helix-turn-helix domain-containing protein n=1 Tax=Shewanella algae TaxID=38313 RepID=UPI003AAD25FB
MRNEKLVLFGQRVRTLRKIKGLSQESMAALAGLDRSYMGHIERGEKNITRSRSIRLVMLSVLKSQTFFLEKGWQ